MIEEVEKRLRYLPDGKSCLDRGLLERMWEKLDWALQHRRLEVRNEAKAWGRIRVVTALRLLQLEVDHDACDVTAYAIQEDGSRRRIDSSFQGPRIFYWYWWMRYAFQRWAPECSGIDFVVHPLSRPSNVELDTTRALMRRLKVDPRYWTLFEEFNAAIGTPSLISEILVETDERFWHTLAEVCEVWRQMETGRRRPRGPSA